MDEISEEILIEAPVADVFAYMDQPTNQLEISPSLTRAETLATLPNGGKRVAYTYTIAGFDLEGELEATEYEPDQFIRWEMTGDLTGTIEWQFEATDAGTRMTYATTYEMPNRIIEVLAGPFVSRYNERELRTTLENLKTRLEHDSET
ncbi:MAG: SRPBCC family protein [Halobacteriales archaeon]|nr:SRPBCC family protein [Halobacteriales archaeon]